MPRSRGTEPKSAQLSIEQMKAAIPKLERRIKDLETFDVAAIQKRWDPTAEALVKKVKGTLQEILGHETVEYDEYSVHSLDTLPVIIGGRTYPLSEVHEGYREGIEGAVMKLKTLKELFEERIADSMPTHSTKLQNFGRGSEGSGRIFVVHGRDEGVKEAVARYLSKLNLHPIILHEQANQGKTVIEKFEAHADVEYAVVLFTPDDVGYPADEPSASKPRARQNVVLELGFFLGVLSRERVCVLYKGNMEMPSDYTGVLYVPLDDEGAWRLTLAREIKNVGIDIDLNKTV